MGAKYPKQIPNRLKPIRNDGTRGLRVPLGFAEGGPFE